jgi:hypothetical protein
VPGFFALPNYLDFDIIADSLTFLEASPGAPGSHNTLSPSPLPLPGIPPGRACWCYSFSVCIYKKVHPMYQNKSKQLGQYQEDIFTYYPNGSVKVRMDNILTTDQVLFPGMLLLKSEGQRFDVVKVLEVWDDRGFLYVKVEDNKTGRVMNLSQRIDVDYYVWTLVSYDYLDSSHA